MHSRYYNRFVIAFSRFSFSPWGDTRISFSPMFRKYSFIILPFLERFGELILSIFPDHLMEEILYIHGSGGCYPQLDSSEFTSLELEWINHPTFPLSLPRSWVDACDLAASLQILSLLLFPLGGIFLRLMRRSLWLHWGSGDPYFRIMTVLAPKFVKTNWRKFEGSTRFLLCLGSDVLPNLNVL